MCVSCAPSVCVCGGNARVLFYLLFLAAVSRREAKAERRPKTTKVPPITAQHRVMKCEKDLGTSRTDVAYGEKSYFQKTPGRAAPRGWVRHTARRARHTKLGNAPGANSRRDSVCIVKAKL